MKEKLIKLLRSLENQSGFRNNYTEYDQSYQSHYGIEEYLTFPNYRFIIDQYNATHSITNENGLVIPFSTNAIQSELKRMEAEGLVMVGVQEATKFAYANSGHAPDFDDAIPFTTESIILTTKGKSWWDYFVYKATEENPISTALSVIAIIISIFAIIKG